MKRLQTLIALKSYIIHGNYFNCYKIHTSPVGLFCQCVMVLSWNFQMVKTLLGLYRLANIAISIANHTFLRYHWTDYTYDIVRAPPPHLF